MKDLVFQHVCLDGYSSSKRFIGYFEIKKRFSTELVEETITHFFCYFEKILDGFCLVSSSHVHSDVEELQELYDVNEDELEKMEFLNKAGLIKCVDFNKLSPDFNSKEHADKLEKLDLNLIENYFSSLSLSDLHDILFCILSIGLGIKGHCFLVSNNEGLILYPHEDVGFGVIAINDSAKKSGIDFLLSVKKSENFFVKIE